jgi:predicted secreted protein
MSKAVAGVGTTIEMDGTPVAEVITISGPTMTRDQIDVTSLDSTGGYREFIAGFRDGGQVTLNMNFTATSYSSMLSAYNDEDLHEFIITLPDSEGTTVSFSGIVTECPLSIPTDDKITSDVNIKVTGEVLLNSGS